MVIDANKDAAKECVLRAKEAMKSNDMPRMQKLLRKAKQLDPSCDVSSILRNGQVFNNCSSNSQQDEENDDNSYSHDDQYNSFDEAEALRNRKAKAKSDSPGPSHTGKRPTRSPNRNSSFKEAQRTKSRSKSSSRNASNNVNYTTEEASHVDRIRHCKDYYEILQISSVEFNETLLKKKYKELALKLHPDKCKAPGATEAFKALGNAYAVLSDSKKREDYDRFGSEDQGITHRNHRHHHRHHHSEFYEFDVNRGFEAEMSPEDIFEMFFGGAFSNTTMNRRRTQFHFRQNYGQQQEEPLLQILPILVILIGGLLVQFFSSEPPYSLNRDSTYIVQRFTRDLQVPYFVKQDFEQKYRDKTQVQHVENSVENEYISVLRNRCQQEKINRESLLWTAKIRGDASLWKRAQEMELVYCLRERLAISLSACIRTRPCPKDGGCLHRYKSDEENDDNSYSHDDQYNSFDEAEALRNRKAKAKSDSPGPSHTGKRPTRSPNRNSSFKEAQRTKSRSKSSSRNASNNVNYTTEEASHVDRIRHCKDYYEILQISSVEFSETLLKKKYKELALKLHPDKCKAPGATEAFKALGNAYAVLSDSKKREDYDRFGSEDQGITHRNHRHHHRHHHSEFYEFDVNRGFEAEMSPEDIFEMFFGGAFSNTTMNRRRTQFHFRQNYGQQQEEPSLLHQLLQILPILVILIGGLLVQFFSSEPPYSLNRDSTYIVQRFTRDLQVPYFVKQDFEQKYRDKTQVQHVENSVENEYISVLRNRCQQEKINRESLLWTAKIRGDASLWKRAQEMELVYCKKLEELYH
uniref:J domain-containing protein n=1 Tax=Meloidogyne incognita TaxID=6306 RepID=A0A914MP43_MELIC